MTHTPSSGFEGYIDHVDWHGLRGWAFERATPDEPLWLEVQVDDEMPVAFLANLHRADLITAGYGHGNFGFDLRFPVPLDPLTPHRVVVRRRQDMQPLQNAPVLLQAAPMGSAERRRIFEDMLRAEIAATVAGPEIDVTIGYLLRQVNQLLDARAGASSGVAALQQFRLRWNDYLAGTQARPLQPDARPWVLLICTEWPETALHLATIRAIQALGFRVAVAAQRGGAADDAVASALAAMDVRVLAEPEFFTVEDALRRHRGLFRAVLLWGTLIAAAYSLIVRMHQPRTRILSLIGDIAIERVEVALLLAAAMMNDHLIVESDETAAHITQRLPGKPVVVLQPDSEMAEIAAILTPLLPKLRITRPSADPDAS